MELDLLYARTIKEIQPAELRHMILDNSASRFVIVDVRDSDFKYLKIQNALNYPSRLLSEDAIASLLHDHPSDVYIFHCMRSQNRGPRCAKKFIRYFFKNVIKDDFSNIDDLPKVYILKGGFKTWYQKYGEDSRLVEEI